MDFGGYRVKLKKGGSIGDFYVTGLKTDDKGNIYVDPNSNTVTTDPDTWIYAGNTDARARLGWNNQFSWKGISLGALFDARIRRSRCVGDTSFDGPLRGFRSFG